MKEKISITIDREVVALVENMLKDGRFRNRSHVFEYSLRKLMGRRNKMDTNSSLTLADIFKKRLKQKLEEKVLEIADLRLGQTDLDASDYLEIAEKNKWPEIVSAIHGHDQDLGEAKRKNLNREKKEREQREKHFEDYLITDNRLSGIEPGLKYKGRQKNVLTGRLDIFAQDSNDRDVVIELKTERDSDSDSILQIMKYMGEHQEARIMFLAPKITPTVFFTLRSHVESGRLQFFKETREGEDYSISPVTYEYFKGMKPKQIDWTRKPNPNPNIVTVVNTPKKSGIATIVRPKREEEKPTYDVEPQAVQQPEQTFAGGDEIRIGTLPPNPRDDPNWDSYPLYYQVLRLMNPEMGNLDLESYLSPRPITNDQRKGLESLIMPNDLKKVLEEHEKMKDWIAPGPEETGISKSDTLIKFVKNKVKKVYEGIMFITNAKREFGDKCNGLLEIVSKQNTDPSKNIKKYLRESGERVKILESFLYGALYGKRNTEHIGILKVIADEAALSGDVEGRTIALDVIRSASLIEERAKVAYMKYKNLRAKRLLDVDPLIGRSYLGYSRVGEMIITHKKNIDPYSCSQNVYVDSEGQPLVDLFADMARDQKAYESILSNLVVNPEELQPTVEKNPIVQVTQKPQESPKPIIQEPTPYEILEQAVSGNGSSIGIYSQDSQARIRYFAEDSEKYGITGEQLDSLKDSFNHFKLAKHMRHREEFPTDLRIRNFFDDITLRYLRNGKIPTKDDLDKLYEGSKA